MSRALGILSLVAGLLTVIAGLLDGIRPQWALIASGLAVAINAFTERVQGGASKLEDE